jgi:hypothetical protein
MSYVKRINSSNKALIDDDGDKWKVKANLISYSGWLKDVYLRTYMYILTWSLIPLFFTYALLAVVYVSHWLRIDFLTPLVCNLSK